MMNKEVIEKIQNLLKKAEGTNNEHEAQTFFNGAQRLMAKHGLQESDIKVKDEKVKIDNEEILDERGTSIRNVRLAHIVAKNFKCMSVRYGTSLKMFGLPDDVKIATMTFTAIHKFMEKRRRQIYKQAQKEGRTTKGIREDYTSGLLKGLEENFEANKQEYGLIVVTPQAVKDFVLKDLGCKMVSTKSKSIGQSDIYHKGYQDGKSFGNLK